MKDKQYPEYRANPVKNPVTNQIDNLFVWITRSSHSNHIRDIAAEQVPSLWERIPGSSY